MFHHFQSLQCSDEVMSTSVRSMISCNETDETRSLQAKLGQMLSMVVCDHCHVLKDEKKFEGEVVSLWEQISALKNDGLFSGCAEHMGNETK